ncbi:MAG: hypothetical protein ACTSPB_21835 [Candidatus Thorarchaeota archaeon]
MNSGTGGAPVQYYIEKPSEATIEKIDFVIQGVENGLFKDLSKKIDFHQKLKGEDSKKFVESLLAFVEDQQKCIHDLQIDLSTERSKSIDAEVRITELETKVNNYNTDMRGVANAFIAIANPDPLGQNYAINIDQSAVDNFITNFKSKY